MELGGVFRDSNINIYFSCCLVGNLKMELCHQFVKTKDFWKQHWLVCIELNSFDTVKKLKRHQCWCDCANKFLGCQVAQGFYNLLVSKGKIVSRFIKLIWKSLTRISYTVESQVSPKYPAISMSGMLSCIATILMFPPSSSFASLVG